MSIIYGKGTHSKNDDDVHVVKQAVTRVMAELKNNIISCQEDENNTADYMSHYNEINFPIKLVRVHLIVYPHYFNQKQLLEKREFRYRYKQNESQC